MVKASTGLGRGGRRRLKREVRHKFTVERTMKAFKPGEKVIITIDPSTQRGKPPLTYAGSSGTVVGVRGNSFAIRVKKGARKKDMIVRPEHLARST